MVTTVGVFGVHRASTNVHPFEFGGVLFVEQPDRMHAAVAGDVPVVMVDQVQLRHDALLAVPRGRTLRG